jgi:hypothetical protein
MHDAELLRADQRRGNLPRDAQRAGHVERPSTELVAQQTPLDVLQRQEQRTVVELAEIERRGDVRMFEVRASRSKRATSEGTFVSSRCKILSASFFFNSTCSAA